MLTVVVILDGIASTNDAVDDTTSPQYRATYDFFGNKVLLENSELYKSAQAITLSYVEQYDPFAEFKK